MNTMRHSYYVSKRRVQGVNCQQAADGNELMEQRQVSLFVPVYIVADGIVYSFTFGVNHSNTSLVVVSFASTINQCLRLYKAIVCNCGMNLYDLWISG